MILKLSFKPSQLNELKRQFLIILMKIQNYDL